MHIRQGYSASCNNLVLTVESGSGGWTVLVNDPQSHRTLYTAERSNAEAAKNAAIDFATLCHPGTLDLRAARHLTWQPYW